MNLPHPADNRPVRHHFGGAARLQLRGLLGGKRPEAHFGQRQLAGKVLQHALGVEEVEGHRRSVPRRIAHGAGQDAGELLALLGLLAALGGHKHRADLVELDVLHAAGLVVGHRAQKPGHDGLAHDRHVRIQRVQKLHGQPQPLGGQAQPLDVAGLGEGVGHGLAHAGGAQGVVDHAHRLLLRRARAHALAAAGQRRRDAVHAPQAQHFLVQVNLALQVGTEGGRQHREHGGVVGGLNGTAEAHENVLDEVGGDIGPHHGHKARNAEDELRTGGGKLVDVHHAGTHGAPGHLGQKRRRGLGDYFAQVIVHTALVAHGGLGDKAQVAARAGGAAALEGGGLQKHTGGLLGDLAVLAAHDAGERHGALGGGDDRHVARQLAVLPVQGGEVLAVGGGAHDDMGAPVGAGHFREIEGVQRLAVQVQDVVRHVHDVVDGTSPGGGHALGEPLRGRPHLHVVDDPGGVARAARGIGHLNGDSGRHVLAGGHGSQFLHVAGKRPGHRLLVHGAHLAGHAHHGQAVRPVRRDLQVEHGIPRAHEVRHRLAHRRIFGKHPNAGMVLPQSQLALRAAHAAAHHAAQLRFLDLEIAGQHRAHERHGHLDVRRDVRRPADDLHGFLDAHIHRHHVHVIGIRMRLAGEHVPHHNALEGLAGLLHAFHARARQIEPVAERLQILRHRRILRKPLQRYFHTGFFLLIACLV